MVGGGGGRLYTYRYTVTTRMHQPTLKPNLLPHLTRGKTERGLWAGGGGGGGVKRKRKAEIKRKKLSVKYARLSSDLHVSTFCLKVPLFIRYRFWLVDCGLLVIYKSTQKERGFFVLIWTGTNFGGGGGGR